MKRFVLFFFLSPVLISDSVFAGMSSTIPATITTTPGVTTGTSRTDTRAYVGLNWTLGGGGTPALVLGVTNTKVKSSGKTTGARLAFHVNLAGGMAPGMLRLSYLDGRENLQGELGAGYNFIKAAPALGIGLSGPYVVAGIDGYMNTGIEPYVTVHSQGAFRKPKPDTTPGSSVSSCPPDYTLLNPTTCVMTPQ